MTTYCGTAQDVVSTHAPADVSIAATTPAEALQDVWDSLDPRLRVTAFAIAADDPSVPAMICADAP